MTEKTLLVLAASAYQLDAIRAAKSAGYRVVTTDNVPANPGHALADRSYAVDTTDREAVLKLARAERIDGVISPATDVAVSTAAYVAERLRLPGPPLPAATILTEKIRFRAFLKERAFPCPETFAVAGPELRSALRFGGRRWLVKPNRASGSKGVFIVASPEEFRLRAAESVAFSADRSAVLEEYIEGTQHTCEGSLRDGRIAFCLTTDRFTVPPPHTATSGHRVPTRLDQAVQSRALQTIESIFVHLGVRSGAFDCDFVANGDAIHVIEMTPRLGGNSLARLVRAATGFDLVEYAVRHACGDDTPVPKVAEVAPAAIMILGVPQAGRLALDIAELGRLREEPWVRHLILDVETGAAVLPFVNGRHRVGEALFVASSRDELDERAVAVERRLQLQAA